MTVKQLIDKLNVIEDKNRKVVLYNLLNRSFMHANIKNVQISNFASTVYIEAEDE